MKNLYTFLLLLMLTSLQAEVQYTSLDKTMEKDEYGSMMIEGVTCNFSYFEFGFQIDGETDVYEPVIEKPSNGNQLLVSFKEGAVIDGTEHFPEGSQYSFGSYPGIDGDPVNTGEKNYFGFRVISNGNTYYGWIQVEQVSSDKIKVLGFAYDDAPGTGIKTGDKGGQQVVLVEEIKVTSESGSYIIPKKKGTIQLIVEVLPANATDKSYEWGIFNPPNGGVASVTQDGLVTGISEGKVYPFVSANDGSGIEGGTQIVIEFENQKVEYITVTGENSVKTITEKGGTLQMIATVEPEDAEDKSVTWSVTNNTGEATISEDGLLTAVADGKVTVTASSNDSSNVVGQLVVTITNQSVGLGYIKAGTQVQCSPNPVLSTLNVDADAKIQYVSIISLNGKTLMTQDIEGNSEFSLNVEQLSKGTYLLEVRTVENDITTLKFVKQ